MKMPGFLRWLLGLAPVQAIVKAQIARRVKGPTDEQRARDEVYLYGEAWDDAGHKVAMRLRTREAYTLTAESARQGDNEAHGRPPRTGCVHAVHGVRRGLRPGTRGHDAQSLPVSRIEPLQEASRTIDRGETRTAVTPNRFVIPGITRTFRRFQPS